MAITITSCQKQKYPSGRDTYESFGDGTFQILRPIGIADLQEDGYNLWEHGNPTAIEDKIYKYKEISPFVYFVGLKGYTVLNYETGKFVQNKDLNSFPQDQQKVFKEEKFKTLKEKSK